MWLYGREKPLKHVRDQFLEVLWRRLITQSFSLGIACDKIVHNQQRSDLEVIGTSPGPSHRLEDVFAKGVVLDAKV